MRKLVLSLFVVLAGANLAGCGYNKLQNQDEAVKAAWSEVVNQYQRRSDLIPNLVATVKGFAAQEERVLVGVTEAFCVPLVSQPDGGGGGGGGLLLPPVIRNQAMDWWADCSPWKVMAHTPGSRPVLSKLPRSNVPLCAPASSGRAVPTTLPSGSVSQKLMRSPGVKPRIVIWNWVPAGPHFGSTVASRGSGTPSQPDDGAGVLVAAGGGGGGGGVAAQPAPL